MSRKSTLLGRTMSNIATPVKTITMNQLSLCHVEEVYSDHGIAKVKIDGYWYQIKECKNEKWDRVSILCYWGNEFFYDVYNDNYWDLSIMNNPYTGYHLITTDKCDEEAINHPLKDIFILSGVIPQNTNKLKDEAFTRLLSFFGETGP